MKTRKAEQHNCKFMRENPGIDDPCQYAPKPQRTPTPWRVGDAGHTVFGPPNGNPSPFTIATELDKANAAFIVRACNSHEMLLRALKGARQVIRKAMPLMDADDGALFAGEWIDDINEAIAKAEGASNE